MNVLRKEKNEIEFEVAGEDSTLPALLVHRLNEFPEVDFAAYRSEHPLVPKPRVFVRVKRGDPVKAIEKAVEAIKKDAGEFRTLVSKLK